MKLSANPLDSFHLLGQACVGALTGALIAMFIVGLTLQVGGHPLVVPEHLLDWNLHNILFKPREKGFYLLSLILGPIGAYITSMNLWRVNERYIWLVLFVSVPVTTYLARHVIQLDNRKILLFLSIVFMLAFTVYYSRNSCKYRPIVDSPVQDKISLSIYFLLLTAITLILIPRSFTEVAARIGMEMHVAGTLIGPALYFLNGNLLPGVDYYTQYSIGQPWLYSFILGHSAEAAIRNYTVLVIITTWLFFSQFLYLTRWLYQSWSIAILVTFTFMFMLFHCNNHFFDPSSSVLRYPLLGVSAWIFGYWIENTDSLKKTILLGCVIALSLFLNTETGIITVCAITLVTLLLSRPVFPSLWRLSCLGFLSLSCILLLILIVFGIRSFNIDFFLHMLEPLLLFGKYGFGGWPIVWSLHDLNWFYNLVSPGIAVGSLALIFQTNTTSINKARRAVLAFFATVGLLMMAKFINMSLIGLWEMNALGLLVLLGWWGKAFITKYKSTKFSFPYLRYSVPGFLIAGSLVYLTALYLITFTYDPRNPSTLGLGSWIHYPSLMRSIFQDKYACHDFKCVTNRPDPKDILLIKDRTRQGELVAIIDLYDWTYLVGAHRPPLMLFTPSAVTFTKQQLSESLKRLQTARYLFLPKGADISNIAFGKDKSMTKFLRTFKYNYTLEAEGSRLVAWRRISLVDSRESNL